MQVFNRTNNAWSWVGTAARSNATGGVKIGQNLFLPATYPEGTINMTMMSTDYLYVLQVQSSAGTDPFMRDYNNDFGGQRQYKHAVRCIAK